MRCWSYQWFHPPRTDTKVPWSLRATQLNSTFPLPASEAQTAPSVLLKRVVPLQTMNLPPPKMGLVLNPAVTGWFVHVSPESVERQTEPSPWVITTTPLPTTISPTAMAHSGGRPV